MNTNVFRRTILSLLGLSLVGMTVASTASAGTISTWLGNGANNNWNTSGNWSATINTTGTFSLLFSGTPSRTTSTNNIGAVKIDSLQFLNDGSVGKTSRFTLSSSSTANTLSLTSGGSVTSAVVTGTTLQDAISSNVRLLGASTFTIGTNHNLAISGSLNSAGTLVKTGGGTLFVNGGASLSGLQIDQGNVQFTGTAANAAVNGLTVDIGSSGNAGTLLLSASATQNSSVGFRVRGNATISPTNYSNITFTSATFNTADATVTTPVTLSLGGGGLGNLGTQTVNGTIQDNSSTGVVGLTIGAASTDTNVWVIKGVNTYTGDTYVNTSAKLLMDGVVSGSSSTTSTGYLGGSGTFGGAVTISSGTLSPGGTSASGSITETIGTLTVGSLSLASPAVTTMTVSGSTAGSYDQIVGSTSVTYGGTLALTMSGSYANNTDFFLFSGFSSHLGQFDGISLSAGSPYSSLTSFTRDANGDWWTAWTGTPFQSQILKFSESTGTLSVVPEPSTIVFAGIGMAMFGWSSWTRRRAKARRQAIEAAVA